MIVLRHPGTTRTLGKSQGYIGLPIVDVVLPDETPAMVSFWEPTPRELEALNNGASVMLQVLGVNHPPVSLNVSDPKTVDAQG